MVEGGEHLSGAGRTSEYAIIPAYHDELARQFSGLRTAQGSASGGTPRRVVVDSGNGVAGLVAPALLKAVGCDVIELYSEPDARFPHHHPDPTVLDTLRDVIATVKERRADVGIAYDGDADRLGVIDERGDVLWGD